MLIIILLLHLRSTSNQKNVLNICWSAHKALIMTAIGGQTCPCGWLQCGAASLPTSHSALRWSFQFPVGDTKAGVSKWTVNYPRKHFPKGCGPTLSLSMASSLAGLKMRSCRLLMEPARLERADSVGEGLIPVIALDTVERSPLWLTAWRLLTKFL